VSKQPKWREDFPIAWGEDNYITRREFTKFLVLTSGATFLGNGYFVAKGLHRGKASYPTRDIAGTEELKPGEVKLFRYPTEDDPALLVRLPNGELRAYLQRCTHLSCPVHYSTESQRIECPCHNGAFNAETGRVLEGPPPRPLPRIALRIEGGRLYAEGIEETA
jgi:Rieske Fe-S protein